MDYGIYKKGMDGMIFRSAHNDKNLEAGLTQRVILCERPRVYIETTSASHSRSNCQEGVLEL